VAVTPSTIGGPLASIPFLYQDLVNSILQPRSRRSRALIVGARRMGRSTVLEELHTLLKDERRGDGARLVFVARVQTGESDEDARRKLIDAMDAFACAPLSGATLTLLVDDFDKLYDRDVEKALQGCPEAKTRLYFTSRIGKDELEERAEPDDTAIDADSVLVTTFDEYRLDPWNNGGLEALKNMFCDAISRVSDVFHGTEGGQEVVTERIVQTWARLSLDVTGGHPHLLRGAWLLFCLAWCSRLNLTLEDVPSTLRDQLADDWPVQGVSPRFGRLLDGDKHLQDRLGPALEDHLTKTRLPDLQRTIRRMEKTRPDLFEALRKVALGAPLRSEFTATERDGLLDSGLVYSRADPDGMVHLVIPSSLVREIVCPPVRIHRVEIVTGKHIGACDIVLHTSRGERLVPLTGRPGAVLLALHKAMPAFLTVSDIAEAIGLDEGADSKVRNGIKNLMKVLKDEGIESLVENAHGRGYRVVLELT
jgi:hypothetical protein